MANVAIILDNKSRDLDGISFLINSLRNRHFKVFIVPQNLMQFELRLIKFNFIIFNFYRSYNANLIHEILNSGIHVGVSDTEGGIFSDLNIFFNTWPNNSMASKYSNFHYFFWGPRLMHLAIKKNITNQKTSYLVGSPRFDIYKNFGKKYIKNIKNQDDFILINTNYPFFNPKFNSGLKELERSITLYQNNIFYENLFETQKKEFNETINLAKYLARHSGFKIKIRPHPFENHAIYENIFASYENVNIEYKGSAFKSIKKSILVIQRGCSTGLESRLLGKLSISPDWPPYKHKTLVDQGNVFIKTRKELLALLKQKKKCNYKKIIPISSETKRNIRDFLYKIDGKASERISAIINNEIKFSKKSIFSYFFIKCLFVKFIYSFFYKNQRIYLSERKKWKTSDKYLTCDDLYENLTFLGLECRSNKIENAKIANHSLCTIVIHS